MKNSTAYTSSDIRFCAIIPTYNNAATLEAVIEGTHARVADVWVVNDGSTDDTSDILDLFADRIHVITFESNRGKGAALKAGFKAAAAEGFDYAITIDSDGQHRPSDIPLLIEAVSKHPGAVVTGARQLSDVDINRKSSFANKFSNFWFTIQTFRRLSDTQTGMRAYPLRRVLKALPPSNRYEAELAMLVLLSWHGTPIVEQPINVYYPPAHQRVSHFKPGRDFTRISLLNTILCFLAVVYALPLAIGRGIKWLWHKCVHGLPGRVVRTVVISLGFTIYTLIMTPLMSLFGLFRRRGISRISYIHRTICLSARIGTRLFPGVKFRTLNPHNIDLSHRQRGMIAVCNHASYLDLPALMRISPKLVFVANARISDNRIFSHTFRQGGNCSTADGFDGVARRTRQLVDNGFTVVVFPEGTRSADGNTGRWHSGAFELARHADTDILPMVIHGSAKVLGRHDRMPRCGKITVEIGTPIPSDTPETTRQMASRIRREFIAKLKPQTQGHEK